MIDDTMKYKGYVAQIKYSETDRCFYGDVLHIKDSLSFHGENVNELEESFHKTIDEYLSMCVCIEKNVEKQGCNSTIILNIEKSLEDDLIKVSKKFNTNVEQVINKILKKRMEEIKNEKEKSEQKENKKTSKML